MSTPITCHFGDGPAVAILTYNFPNAPRRNHYRVCRTHYLNFNRTDLAAVKWLDRAAQAELEAAER